MTLEEKHQELRTEYSKTKYNKATNKHLGILRKKIAKIRRELSEKKGSTGVGFAVRKTGDATVALVGFPNAGKSSFLGDITNAESRIADYAFTTLTVIPGMLEYNGAKIQILDIPGLIEGASIGKGGGRKIVSVIRIADIIAFVVDVNNPSQLYKLIDELFTLDIRVNSEPPRIRLERRKAGGIDIEANGHKVPAKQDIVSLLGEAKMYNAYVVFYQNATLDDLSDALDNNITYVSAITLLNKIDTVDRDYASTMAKELEKTTGMPVVQISAAKRINLESAKEAIFSRLDVMRIYLKPKGGAADMERPLIIRKNSTVMDVAKKLHSKTANLLKHAYVSGRSVKFSNQLVGGEHRLMDGDMVTLAFDK
ncbi:MAG: GTP-binding protein [Candidatus Marsarchaeota archaeon]|nr:GTP-binding protein [Candidatus Marsarchaeota archaeon]